MKDELAITEGLLESSNGPLPRFRNPKSEKVSSRPPSL
jgi:hypothetical protein